MWTDQPPSTSDTSAPCATPRLWPGLRGLRRLADVRAVLGAPAGPAGAVARDDEHPLRWRASNAQALFEQVAADGVTILAEPFDGPFGRTFAMADPDGYRITVYEKDQPLFWPPRRGR